MAFKCKGCDPYEHPEESFSIHDSLHKLAEAIDKYAEVIPEAVDLLLEVEAEDRRINPASGWRYCSIKPLSLKRAMELRPQIYLPEMIPALLGVSCQDLLDCLGGDFGHVGSEEEDRISAITRKIQVRLMCKEKDAKGS